VSGLNVSCRLLLFDALFSNGPYRLEPAFVGSQARIRRIIIVCTSKINISDGNVCKFA
jgi:hypothetical protein